MAPWSISRETGWPKPVKSARELLCRKWPGQRELGRRLGYDMIGAAWVAVRSGEIQGYGLLAQQVFAEISGGEPEGDS